MDTLKYNHRNDYDILARDKNKPDGPALIRMKTGAGSSHPKHSKSSGMDWAIDDMIDGYLNSKYPEKDGFSMLDKMDDEGVDKYKRTSEALIGFFKENGAEALWKEFPNLKEAFPKYEEAFGSE